MPDTTAAIGNPKLEICSNYHRKLAALTPSYLGNYFVA
jgi:hypothetical protein